MKRGRRLVGIFGTLRPWLVVAATVVIAVGVVSAIAQVSSRTSAYGMLAGER
jgi:hypothetical protein